jgi:hypothetical protein
MPLFYFHMQYAGQTVQDDEGGHFADLEAARAEAVLAARDMWADAIKAGKNLEMKAFLIADSQNRNLVSVSIFEGLPPRLRSLVGDGQ